MSHRENVAENEGEPHGRSPPVQTPWSLDGGIRQRQIRLLENYYWNARYKYAAHSKAEAFNRRANKVANFSQAVLSMVVGATQIVALAISPGPCDGQSPRPQAMRGSSTALMVAGTVLTFVSATIGVLRNVQKYDTKLAKHHEAAMRFKDLATDIQRYRAGEMKALDAFVDKTCDLLDAHDLAATSIGEKYIAAAKDALAHLPHTESEN